MKLFAGASIGGRRAVAFCFSFIAAACAIKAVAAADEERSTRSGIAYRLDVQQVRRSQAVNPDAPMVSFADAVGEVRFSRVALSPSGRWLVFQTQRGDVANNRQLSQWKLLDLRGTAAARVIAEEIVAAKWDRHDDVLYLATSEEGPERPRSGAPRIYELNPSSGERQAVLDLPRPISDFERSPDGTKWAVVEPEPTARSWSEEPYHVYVGDAPAARALFTKSYGQSRTSSVAVFGSKGELIGRWDVDGRTRYTAWSPDSTRILFQHDRMATPEQTNNVDIGLIALGRADFERVVTWYSWEEKPVWLSNERFLFASPGERKGYHPFNLMSWDQRFYTYDLSSSRIERLERLPLGRRDGTRATVVMGEEILYEDVNAAHERRYFRYSPRTGARSHAVPHRQGQMSEFSPSTDAKRIAYVFEDLAVAPEIYIHEPGKAPRAVTNENLALTKVRLYPGFDFWWKNNGEWSHGYLIPPRREAGSSDPWPMVVVMYGFDRRFTTWAQYIANYPVQWFADRGIAVLLWNYAPFVGWKYGDVADAYEQEIMKPHRSIMAATDVAVELGLADAARLGIMGHSMGGQWGGATIVRTGRFRAASLHEPAPRNVTSYWTGSRLWQYLMEGMHGGPPLGATLANYEKFCPDYARPTPRTPVLLEASTRWLSILDQFTAWRAGGTPSELILYADEDHNVKLPANQLAATQLNLDWFSFWLLGREDGSPEKAAQYARWKTYAGSASQQGR